MTTFDNEYDDSYKHYFLEPLKNGKKRIKVKGDK